MMSAQQLEGGALLTVWERALAQPPEAREDVLLQAVFEKSARAQTLGQFNARLIDAHARLFGRELALRSGCARCGSVAQFSTDCAQLAAPLPVTAGDEQSHRLRLDEYEIEFRLPGRADITAVSSAVSDNDFALQLLERCVLACTRDDAPIPISALPDAVLDALSQKMEALDPAASISFAVACPQCDARWDAKLDVGSVLWQKIQAAAEHLLLDIDALARAYGWSEREILQLTALRRAAYLQMVSA